MKKNFIFVIAVLFFVCCSESPKGDEFLIKGKLENAEGVFVVLKEITPGNVVTVDSIETNKEGEFSFRRKMPYQSLYIIAVSPVDYITILPDYKETIIVTGDYNAFSESYEIEGSPESGQLWELNRKNLEGLSVKASLARAWNEAKYENREYYIKDSLDQIYEKTFLGQRQFVLDFIDRNAGSLTTLIGIYKSFDGKDLLSSRRNFDIYEKVASDMEKKMPDNPHVIKFVKHVKEMKEEAGTMDEYENITAIP